VKKKAAGSSEKLVYIYAKLHDVVPQKNDNFQTYFWPIDLFTYNNKQQYLSHYVSKHGKAW
jgi:hypothetical protein